MKTKPKAYFAAPLFNGIERDFNKKISDELSPFLEIFLPQRDGLLLKDLIKNGIPVDDAKKIIYNRDIDAISNCEVIIAVLDGRTIDEGVAVELGYARALKKKCIGLKTDDRTKLSSGDNPMITCSCDIIFSCTDTLIDHFKNSRSCHIDFPRKSA